MFANTPNRTNKRPISEGSTPSPSIKKSNKTAKLEDTLEESVDPTMSNPNQSAPMQSKDMLALLQTGEIHNLNSVEKWHHVMTHLSLLSEQVSELQSENKDLRASIATANGKIAFLENQVEKAKTKIGNIEWKELQDDIVLYNLVEISGKPDEETLKSFLTEELRIDHNSIRTTENNSGAIHIDTLFRIGKQQNKKPRPLIVSFALKNSKKLVMEQYRKVQKTLHVKITDHFPSEMRERRSVQKDALKKYKEIYRDTDKKVTLVKDKLLVGSRVIGDAFVTNPLTSAPCSLPVNETVVKHTNIKEVNGSRFQGHAKSVNTISEAAAVKDTLFQLPAVSQCDHLIYAYNITDPSGMKISGHNDGGEWAASKLLENLLEERGLTNVFLAVTRKHDGPNLGQKRFNFITEMGSKALDMLTI